jgi:hypothetical protein
MAVRIAPQHTAASTRLPLTRGIRFPRHGCYGLWAARIPSRHATCRYSCSRPSEPVSSSHPDGPSRHRVVRDWRSPVSLVSRHPQSPKWHPALRLEASRARREKNCVRPRLSTPPTPPGGSGTGHLTDGVCLLLDLLLIGGSRCLRNPHWARRARFAAVSPGCLRCLPETRSDALRLGHPSKALRFRRRGGE